MHVFFDPFDNLVVIVYTLSVVQRIQEPSEDVQRLLFVQFAVLDSDVDPRFDGNVKFGDLVRRKDQYA